jgi:transposase-like protein
LVFTEGPACGLAQALFLGLFHPFSDIPDRTGTHHAIFQYPPDIRKAIYTTNSVESLNRSLRKIIKTRGGFPNEEAALKLLFLALRQAAKKWTMPIHHWREALNHFTILWPGRMPVLERTPQ